MVAWIMFLVVFGLIALACLWLFKNSGDPNWFLGFLSFFFMFFFTTVYPARQQHDVYEKLYSVLKDENCVIIKVNRNSQPYEIKDVRLWKNAENLWNKRTVGLNLYGVEGTVCSEINTKAVGIN